MTPFNKYKINECKYSVGVSVDQ